MHTFTPTQKNTHCYLCTTYPLWILDLSIYFMCVWVYRLMLKLSSPQASSRLWWLPCVVYWWWEWPFPWRRKGQSDTVASPKCRLLQKKATIERETINHSVRWGHTFWLWVTPEGNTILLWIMQVCLHFCNHTKQHYSKLTPSLGLSSWFDTT